MIAELSQRWGVDPKGLILILDNRDSFVYNLAHGFNQVDEDVTVRRSDEVSAEWVLAAQPKAVVLSPGPGRPEDAGCCLELLRQAPSHLPILGVCLGHQALCHAFGIPVNRCEPRHGKTSRVDLLESELFLGVDSPMEVGRYHSLGSAVNDVRAPLRVTASTEGLAMAVQHESNPWFGVQFHPESVLSESGVQILKNFAHIVKTTVGR